MMPPKIMRSNLIIPILQPKYHVPRILKLKVLWSSRELTIPLAHETHQGGSNWPRWLHDKQCHKILQFQWNTAQWQWMWHTECEWGSLYRNLLNFRYVLINLAVWENYLANQAKTYPSYSVVSFTSTESLKQKQLQVYTPKAATKRGRSSFCQKDERNLNKSTAKYTVVNPRGR